MFGNTIKKSDAERLFRIEDANVNASTYVDPKTKIRSYESGNWMGSDQNDFLYYLNHTARAGVPRGAGNMLDPNANRRLITGYLDKETADLFRATNPDATSVVKNFSGGPYGPKSSEFLLPPDLMDVLRSQGKTLNREEMFKAFDDFTKKYGGDLPKAQYGLNLLDDLVKAGAKKFGSAFRKPPKLNVTGLDDAVYKTGRNQYDNLTMQQLNDVVSNRKAWINSDEYFTRRFNQLRKSDAYKYLPKDDLTNLIKSNVKSMENAFDDLTIKFSKDFDNQGVYTGKQIGIKTPDGSGVGYSPTLDTYLDVFDHEVMHALQPKLSLIHI